MEIPLCEPSVREIDSIKISSVKPKIGTETISFGTKIFLHKRKNNDTIDLDKCLNYVETEKMPLKNTINAKIIPKSEYKSPIKVQVKRRSSYLYRCEKRNLEASEDDDTGISGEDLNYEYIKDGIMELSGISGKFVDAITYEYTDEEGEVYPLGRYFASILESSEKDFSYKCDNIEEDEGVEEFDEYLENKLELEQEFFGLQSYKHKCKECGISSIKYTSFSVITLVSLNFIVGHSGFFEI